MKKVIAIGLMGALLITSPIYSTVAFSATLPTENPTVQTDPTLTETPVENPEQVAAELDEEHYVTIAGTKVLLYPNQQKATLDGISTPLAAAPYVDYDTTMIPLRFIAQDVLKAQVLWNQQTQDVTITKDGKVVILKTKTGKVLVDGTEKPMPKPPVVKGDYTFVPLRLVAEIFGCRVGYENTPQERVTIQTPDLKVERPHASVTLPTKITAGQALTAQDNSSDPNGLAITAHHWQITLPGEQPVGTTDLAAAFKRPTPGVYELAYTVCNEKGAWSQPFSTQLEVLLNSAPVISRLTADNSHPSIGQTVDFQYTTSNEEWEEITETRWEFSYLSAGKVVVKPEKPRAFFCRGQLYRATERQGQLWQLESAANHRGECGQPQNGKRSQLQI